MLDEQTLKDFDFLREGWTIAFFTNFKDVLLVLLFGIPWVILNVFYSVFMVGYLLAYPVVAAFSLITPWREDREESFFLWWSLAVEYGVMPQYPGYIPDLYLIQRAKEMVLERAIDEQDF